MKTNMANVAAVCLAVACTWGQSALLADTRTVVGDPFTDGGAGDGADLLDVAWENRVGPVALTVENAELTAGGGNALKYSASTQNRSIAAAFPTVGLAKAGDWAQLDMAFKVSVGFTAGSLTVGFANTNGLVGYHMQLAANGAANAGVFQEVTPTNTTQITPKITTAAFGTTTHTVSILLKRVADANPADGNTDDDLEFTFGSDLYALGSALRTDDTPSALTFNQVWLGNLGTGSGTAVAFYVDNVTVTTNVPLPPPTGTVVAVR
jgi:hypothetical protein